MHHILHELRGHGTNALGIFATATSGALGLSEDDAGRSIVLFAVSMTVGILTAIHLALQIRKQVRDFLEEKRKNVTC